MRFNSVKRGNFSGLAKSVNQNADAIFRAARDTAVNHTQIAKASIDGRSVERRAAMKAEGQVAQAGLKAFTKVKDTKNKIESQERINDIKRPAKRMAGIVGGLGAIAGGYVMREGNKRDKAERDELRAYRAELDRKNDERWEESEKRWEARLSSWKNGGGNSDDPKPSTPAPSGAGSTPKPSTPVSTKPTKLSSAKPGSPFKKIYDLAVEVGGTKFPEIVAAQAMHETGHLNPGIKSVYNSTGGTNPFGQTGDRGYGTIPREGFKDGWTLYPDMKTAVADHIKLWHDTGNHSGNYNAFNTRREGIASVTPSYSPNADPQNIRNGYTEDAYSSSMKKILEANGYSF